MIFYTFLFDSHLSSQFHHLRLRDMTVMNWYNMIPHSFPLFDACLCIILSFHATACGWWSYYAWWLVFYYVAHGYHTPRTSRAEKILVCGCLFIYFFVHSISVVDKVCERERNRRREAKSWITVDIFTQWAETVVFVPTHMLSHSRMSPLLISCCLFFWSLFRITVHTVWWTRRWVGLAIPPKALVTVISRLVICS